MFASKITCVFVLLVGSSTVVVAADSDSAPKLTYAISANPGDITVNRMPPIGAHAYTETFVYTVSNPLRTDFDAKAPTCNKWYEVDLYRIDGAARKLIGRWPSKKFCERPKPVKIPAGKSLSPTSPVTWTFTLTSAPKVQDGDYVVEGTFIPTGDKSASAKFKITSTQ